MQLVGKQRWLDSGAPLRCALCHKRFDAMARHGGDGRYYCSTSCEDDAARVQSPEQRLRLVQ